MHKINIIITLICPHLSHTTNVSQATKQLSLLRQAKVGLFCIPARLEHAGNQNLELRKWLIFLGYISAVHVMYYKLPLYMVNKIYRKSKKVVRQQHV